ncbi:hypothetical protein CERZMDRAFT_81752 [Cercospora zeae-maydis SCOH1-5]|uniref:Uncharacterized protein n=1 Tax=Cercospora zeae-maydis SCOH1-5 TaxID=717836 RepID=A0A6A6FQ55_9PEZI|nr:hypothetical protein CERZMDRAFT_81752 [Cercospora zeae-maydis SCOH1-5]
MFIVQEMSSGPRAREHLQAPMRTSPLHRIEALTLQTSAFARQCVQLSSMASTRRVRAQAPALRRGASAHPTQNTCRPVRPSMQVTTHTSPLLLPCPRVPVRMAKLNSPLGGSWLDSRTLIEQLPSLSGASDSFLDVVVAMVLPHPVSGAGVCWPASACGLYLQRSPPVLYRPMTLDSTDLYNQLAVQWFSS